MADQYGGRVLAGEDSEEDDDDDEESGGYGFQFNSFPTRQPSPVVLPRPTSFTAAAPKFAVAAAINASNESNEESDEDEDGDAVVLTGLVHSGSNNSLGLPPTAASTPVASAENTPRNEVELPAVLPPASPSPIGRYEPKQPPVDLQPKHETSDDEWAIDGSINGVEAISEAVVQNLQPSLDAAIQRIAELLSSQQHLLEQLSAQNASVCASEQIENVALVMNKVPYYSRKVHDIKATAFEITNSVERLKKRAESLRIDAQSHAIKKENKRDAMSQWNKLYAAKGVKEGPRTM